MHSSQIIVVTNLTSGELLRADQLPEEVLRRARLFPIDVVLTCLRRPKPEPQRPRLLRVLASLLVYQKYPEL